LRDSAVTTTILTLHGRHVRSVAELVLSLPAEAVASPCRSTVPLVDYRREPEARLADMWRRIGCRLTDRAELHFEFQVPVQAGRGKPSYTDLMILSDDIAVAIEAKFTEPRYETVGDWLLRAPTANRGDVLNGWLSAIGAVTGTPITREAVSDVPYQMLHRTASVCCVNRSKRFVVYQVFGDAPPAHYVRDLACVALAGGAGDRIGFVVLTCGFRATATYGALHERWQQRERSLGVDIRQALLAGRLFEFREPASVPVHPAG
jgi:hypothetical protein